MARWPTYLSSSSQCRELYSQWSTALANASSLRIHQSIHMNPQFDAQLNHQHAFTDLTRNHWYPVLNTPFNPESSSCESYVSRYAPYQLSYNEWHLVNECITTPSATVLIRVHSRAVFNQDLVMNIRSLIIEAGLMMNHRVVLFVNVKETEYTNNKSRSDMWTDEEKLKILTKSSVPKEFWPLSWLWTNSEVHNFEPSYTSQYHHPHIPLSYYLHLHPQTQYTYFIEQDVRSTSRWTETLPSHKPALLTFQHLCTPPQKWSHLPSCINFPREEMKKGLGAIWGLSTELILATRKYNASCYYEGFLPTVARMESLTTQFHAHALYRKVGRWRGGGTDDLCRDGSEPAVPGEWTYHWEGRGAWQFYEEWKTQGGCWPGALVHPIKS